MILEGYGVGLWMIWLIQNYRRGAIMVCHESGYYGQPFNTGHGVTQDGPLLAKLFNILVDAVVRELFRMLREEGDYKGRSWMSCRQPSLPSSMSTMHTLLRGTQTSYNVRWTSLSGSLNEWGFKLTQ